MLVTQSHMTGLALFSQGNSPKGLSAHFGDIRIRRLAVMGISLFGGRFHALQYSEHFGEFGVRA